jgi:hypothetical protein
MIQISKSFSRDGAVQQDYVAPILLRHIAIAGDETVDSSVVAVGDDAAVAFRVIRQAVAEPQAMLRGRDCFGIFHPGDILRLYELDLTSSAAPQEKLHQPGQLAGGSFHIEGGT